MRSTLLVLATLVAITCCASSALAQSLLYSFEDVNGAGPDGFFGLGATVSQSTTGATLGANALKYEIGVGGFVGARTETVVPAPLNNPPGVSYVLFDLTVTDTYADTFANMGVTLFGHALNAPGGATFGHQVQFLNEYPIAGKAPGTYKDQKINLDISVGPYRPGESFNAIFGPDPNDLTVSSAFQFYINKNALTPLTVYIDNVRVVVPEPASFALLGLGAVVMCGVARRRVA